MYLIYDLDQSENDNLETKKNIYFDAYQGLIKGNILKKSDVFSKSEKEKLQNTSVEIQSSCYTISMTVSDEDSDESDSELLDKYIDESEKWMQEKYNDKSIAIELLQETVTENGQGSSYIMKICCGFVVGAILACLVLFTWFIMNDKIYNDDDIKYYTGRECVAKIKKGSIHKEKYDIDELKNYALLSESKILGLLSLENSIGKTFISREIAKWLKAMGKSVLFVSFEKQCIETIEDELDNLKNILNDLNVIGKRELLDGNIRITFEKDNLDKIVYSNEFKQWLDSCKQEYEYIIVDMDNLSEAITKKVCKLCDDICIFLSKGHDHGTKVSKTLKQFKIYDIKIAGIVLNEHVANKSLLRM